MNRQLIIICAALVLLTGCQLARADGGVIYAQADRLVGVLITEEYLDLFDFERYINDNISQFSAGGEVNITDGSGYEGRIYATLKPVALTSEETGERIDHWEYEFEGVDGIPFFTMLVNAPDGGSYWSGQTDNAISDGHMSMGGDITLEGTVYMTPRSATTVYVNPVYQSGDGRVYVTTGSGYSAAGNDAEGAVFSSTLEEQHTTTENGAETTETTRITVNMAVKRPPRLVRVLQMNAQSAPVAHDEYLAEGLPESIGISPGAEYVIIETVANDAAVTRQIYTTADGSFTVYTARDDGICEGRLVELIWS